MNKRMKRSDLVGLYFFDHVGDGYGASCGMVVGQIGDHHFLARYEYKDDKRLMPSLVMVSFTSDLDKRWRFFPDAGTRQRWLASTKRRVRRDGKYIQKKHNTLSPEDHAEIIRRRAAGARLVELAKRYECSNSQIWQILRRETDYTHKKYNTLSPEQCAEVIRRRAAGETLIDLAKYYKCSHSQIWQITKRAEQAQKTINADSSVLELKSAG